jgi:hypothetical protein
MSRLRLLRQEWHKRPHEHHVVVSGAAPLSRPLVTATTTAALGAPSRATLRAAFAFRCASAKLAYGKPLSLLPGQASSLMNRLVVMCGSAGDCVAFARVNPLLVVYCFRTPAGRGPGGHRPRPE